ncbi:MAG: hypothetical protein O7C58_07635 [Rickettsia endosymbiont of Ixodes persulcatus]|nr:hypothetical protein [Rickettsia endosymbiont of Ixodes persulcatus]MCZ6909557.1 hypothetical protein [Rickettsia endosymbiont of Ixodes persulcatus]
MPQVSITAAYYALKVGNLEAIPKILNKVNINYIRNGDKEFCREIANEFSTEQNQEVIKQLEQYLITQPEFNITDQLESNIMSIIGDFSGYRVIFNRDKVVKILSLQTFSLNQSKAFLKKLLFSSSLI